MIILPFDKVARVRPLQCSSDKEVERENVFPMCDTEPCGSSLHPVSGPSSVHSYSSCDNQILNLATCFRWPAQKTAQYYNNQWSIRFFCAKEPLADCVPAPWYSLSTSWWAALLATRDRSASSSSRYGFAGYSQTSALLIWSLMFLGTTVIHIILWLILELLNRQESVSAATKERVLS